jgi:hypothetical protein
MTILVLASALLGSGCGAAPAPRSEWLPVVEAFRDCLDTYYAAKVKGPEADVALRRLRGERGGRLIYELDARGEKVSDEEAALGLWGIWPHVERYLHTRTEEVAFAQVEAGDAEEEAKRKGADAWPGSFLVVSGATREEREVARADGRARFGVVRYEDVLVAPLDAARRRSAATMWVAEGTIYALRAAPAGSPERAPSAEAIDVAAARLLARPASQP